jgi:hypothetical protein
MKFVELGQFGQIGNSPQCWGAWTQECPGCHSPIVFLGYAANYNFLQFVSEEHRLMVLPAGSSIQKAPREVPEAIARDFYEASTVLPLSPQASAALSRRCLQQLLEERGVSTKHDLSKAIDDALATGLPSHIARDLDAIREVGNFSAHPQKSMQSGQILPVEPHEAEWTLEVLGQLFDHYYVKPARAAERREAFNAKLADAGRNPLKGPKENL